VEACKKCKSLFAGSVGVMGVIFFSSCYVVLLRLSFSMPDPENGKTVGSVIIVPFHRTFKTVLHFFLSFITLAYAFAVPQLS